MGCPQRISDNAEDSIVMGANPGEVFVSGATAIWRYTFPAFAYTADVLDVRDIDWGPPFGLSPFNSFLGAWTPYVWVDGRFYLWLYSNISGASAIVVVDEDGTNAEVLYQAPTPTGNAHGLITWHPATPGVVWATFLDVDASTHDLFTVNISTGARVDKLDLSSTMRPPQHALHQYDTGLVFAVGSGGSFSTLVAYDVVTDTSATFAAPNLAGFGVYWSERQILWNTNGNQATAVDIDVSGGVTLTAGSTSCDAWDGDGFWQSPWQWFATEDRTRVYISDSSWVWGLNESGGGGWRVGRIGWPPAPPR